MFSGVWLCALRGALGLGYGVWLHSCFLVNLQELSEVLWEDAVWVCVQDCRWCSVRLLCGWAWVEGGVRWCESLDCWCVWGRTYDVGLGVLCWLWHGGIVGWDGCGSGVWGDGFG